MSSPPQDEIHIYTDGACSGNPGPSGLGVVLLDEGAVLELSEYLGQGTNNIAELSAILRAAEKVKGTEKRVLIFTDSQYAIGVLQKNWKAKANQALVAQCKQVLAALDDVKLVYVRGHAGDVYNERADALAVRAVQSQTTCGWLEAGGAATMHEVPALDRDALRGLVAAHLLLFYEQLQKHDALAAGQVLLADLGIVLAQVVQGSETSEILDSIERHGRKMASFSFQNRLISESWSKVCARILHAR